VTDDSKEVMTADVLFVNCHKVSVGTAMEMRMAWEHRKDIIVVVPSLRDASPWTRFHASFKTEYVSVALQYLYARYPRVFSPTPPLHDCEGN